MYSERVCLLACCGFKEQDYNVFCVRSIECHVWGKELTSKLTVGCLHVCINGCGYDFEEQATC
jgi:hypothetical protein